MKVSVILLMFLLLLFSCKKNNNNNDHDKVILIDSVSVNNAFVSNEGKVNNVDFDKVIVKIKFKSKVDTALFNKNKLFFTGDLDTLYSHKFDKSSTILSVVPLKQLKALTLYRMVLDVGSNLGGIFLEGFSFTFTTRIDTLPKFPVISDDSLLTLVQKQTFRYFWDYAHPVSGLARERFGSGDVVTTGGSGFGLMVILVGIERNFITRQQGFERLRKVANFLINPVTDKFHGAYPHWLNGSSGKVYPFSSKDNGGDLVETAFLMQGLLTVKEYFINGSSDEKAMCDTIQKIWENVDWSWYRRNNQNRLFWHWSPNFDWYMNMPVSGWNEALIVYVLAASSPTHSINKIVYDEGWARNGAYPMKNGKSFYGIQLPLGEDYGGPLFFAHYSFLGLDPRNLYDQYASYWTQNTAHSRINYEYCKSNPKKHFGYGVNCWGLTASDIQYGYSASSPNNDLGVIAPTAALSSFPYTPTESMKVLKFFYYTLGDKLWGDYGFYDAFSLSSLWFADSYISIDQGPIVCMIENYRTGFLWDLFMVNADVRNGLDKLGFIYN
ncbi:MAG: glucoamylase family protein [Bacteroidales bacterium]